MNTVNVQIKGSQGNSLATYKTVILKPGDLGSQITEANTKYIIKWDFDIGTSNVSIPEGSILEFDGGTITSKGGKITSNGMFYIKNPNAQQIDYTIFEGTYQLLDYKHIILTEEEYDTLVQDKKTKNDTIYFIIEE